MIKSISLVVVGRETILILGVNLQQKSISEGSFTGSIILYIYIRYGVSITQGVSLCYM